MPVATASVDSPAPQIDDVLTHPVHGPVRIVALRTRTVRGTEREYVDLVVIDDEMQISVPADGKDVVGLRALLGESEIAALIEQLAEPIPAPEKKASWAHRIKSLQMQLQTGRLSDRIEVIRSIVRDSGGTPSSLAERNLLWPPRSRSPAPSPARTPRCSCRAPPRTPSRPTPPETVRRRRRRRRGPRLPRITSPGCSRRA